MRTLRRTCRARCGSRKLSSEATAAASTTFGVRPAPRGAATDDCARSDQTAASESPERTAVPGRAGRLPRPTDDRLGEGELRARQALRARAAGWHERVGNGE